jgi:hypothetical protein
MRPDNKTIVQLMCRLFWLITQGNGVARYASDVELFTNAEVLAGLRDRESADRIINGYKQAEAAK